jgi:hypothetical protein
MRLPIFSHNVIMINKYFYLSFFLLLFIFSCRENNVNAMPELPSDTGKTIIPMGVNAKDKQYNNIVSVDRENNEENLIPFIPIGANWKVIKLLDTNLDSDIEDEQIIILESLKEDSKDILEIWISDYDGSNNSHILAWKDSLSPMTSQTLSLSTNESAVPGFYEIYVMGYNSSDEHVLNVFYPLTENITNPQYKKIFSQTVKGTIELTYPQIEGSSLSDDYGTQVRVSPNIIITQADPASENTLDTIITTWELFPSPPRYKSILTRKIKVSREQEEKLIELINGSVEEFEETISDYWYREEGAGQSIRMINMNSLDREIQFLTMENFESYTWTSSHKSTYAPRLYIYSSSLYIDSVRKELVLNTIDLDTINISVFDNGKQHLNNNWSGNYKRMTEGMKESLIKEFTRELNSSEFDLNGKYKSATGEEFTFDKNKFILENTNKEPMRGYFTLFKLNKDQLLELIYYDDRGIKLKREIYNFEYSMIDDRDQRIRSFNIVPGNVSVKGFTSSEERDKRFEQIEIREKE